MVKTIRLSPEDRKQRILDAIASLIEKGRIADLSISEITGEAGVSKALIYKYYPSIAVMLENLLEREYVNSLDTLTNKLESASTFPEVLHVLVNQNFDECVENPALNTLRNLPSLQQKFKQLVAEEGRLISVLNRVLKNIYDIDDETAGQIMEIGSGASYAAASFYLRKGGDRDQHVEAAIAYIHHGTQALLNQVEKTPLRPVRIRSRQQP